MSWARSADASGVNQDVVVSADADLVESLDKGNVFGSGAVVFRPQSDRAGGPDHLQIFDYVGDFSDPDADIQIGDDFFVQQQSYAVSEFVPVGGPTILRVNSEADQGVFYRDADTARLTGKFPAGLLHPQSVLGDMPRLGLRTTSSSPHHFFVDVDGHTSTSPGGMALGDITDSINQRAARWISGLSDLAQQEPISSRPWIGDFMMAAEALRLAQVRGMPDMQVSGFGGHLVATLTSDSSSEYRPSPFLLLFNDDAALLYESASSRTYKLTRDAAKVIEVMLNGYSELPADAALLLGQSENTVLQSMVRIREMLSAKGIHLADFTSVGA